VKLLGSVNRPRAVTAAAWRGTVGRSAIPVVETPSNCRTELIEGVLTMRPKVVLLVAVIAALSAQAAVAEPLITFLEEIGRDTTKPAAIVTSATHPSPSGTSAELKDRAFAMVNRTHQYTAVRTERDTDPNPGRLSIDASHDLQLFPAYLDGLEYIQISNENRTQANYRLNATFSQDVYVYLFLDNRIGNNQNWNDPVFTGTGANLQWVITEGWERMNTGFMPNGQPDYLGIDEIATVAGEGDRIVNPTPGSGESLNQFYAIYRKAFSAGYHEGFVKQQDAGSLNIYGVAVAVIPEPSTVVMLLAAAAAGVFWAWRRR
jgi:hypothetical protein